MSEAEEPGTVEAQSVFAWDEEAIGLSHDLLYPLNSRKLIGA